MSGIYDVTLAPGASGNIAALGSYAKVSSAPAGAIQMRFDGGEAYSLMEGQGIRLPDGCSHFRDVTIKNTAAIAQTILVFIGDSRFEDTRITGIVSVVDGGKARSIANTAFLGYVGVTASAGNMSTSQIFNPSTTKRLVVKRITVTSTLAGQLSLAQLATNLTASGPFDVFSKLIAAPAAMTAKLWRDGTAAAVPGNSFASLSILANTAFVFQFEEPLIIGPSQGVCTTMQTLAATLLTIYEGFEEANT